MPEPVFQQLIKGARNSAEHMMLIGLGEPFLDRRIFDRIGACHEHGISALISTNGTLLDEAASRRLLDTPLEHITLSFDGFTKESFEYYRKGARFERVRDNFIRFAKMKYEGRAKVQVVVQMVRMERNWNEVDDFIRFWSAVPGVDQVRIKADETNLMAPDRGHTADEWKHPCHYLWRGPMYVKHNGDVYPCCQSYMLDGEPVGAIGRSSLADIWNSAAMQRMRERHVSGRAGEIAVCSRCCTTIPHPLLVAGSLLLHGRTVRKLLPVIERLAYVSKMPGKLLRPPKPAARPEELVQIETTRR
jgi:radical SAM protein with 4Fe4S-binding SPASM domain